MYSHQLYLNMGETGIPWSMLNSCIPLKRKCNVHGCEQEITASRLASPWERCNHFRCKAKRQASRLLHRKIANRCAAHMARTVIVA